MKDSFFEMLLNLFEMTLSKLKENHLRADERIDDSESKTDDYVSNAVFSQDELNAQFFRSPHIHSIRVFTHEERMKLTKASYQFLMRMVTYGIVHPDSLEQIINHLLFSDSRFVTLQETKWAIRKTLADCLNQRQLAFLDLVLYQQEDEYPLH